MSSEKKSTPPSKSIVTAKKVTIIDLMLIQYVLRFLFLPIKNTGFTFEITTNLVKIDQAILDHNKSRDLMDENFVRKNKDGVAISYQAVKINNGRDSYFEHILNENKELIEVTEDYTGETSFFYDRHGADYKAELKKWQEKEIFDSFDLISKDEIKKLMDKKIIDGVDLTPLFRTVIR